MAKANCGGLVLNSDSLVVVNNIITTPNSTPTASVKANCGGVQFDTAVFKKLGNVITDKDMAEEGVVPMIVNEAGCGGLVVDSRCFAVTSGKLVFTNKSSECSMTAYAIGDSVGTITGTDVAVTVPHGTDVTTLVATFTLSSGASAKVGTKAQVSGTTANNFTNPVNYKVTSEGGHDSKTYKVTVTVAPEAEE